MTRRDAPAAASGAPIAGRAARPTSRNGRWLTAVAGGSAVVAVVVAVQLAAGAGVDPAAEQSTDRAAGGAIAGAAALFPVDAVGNADTVRESTTDVTAPWPVPGCQPQSSPESAPTEPGRVDFVTGTESGPGYSRGLAIGWYIDTAAAGSAYDTVLARVQQCARDAGAQTTVEPQTPSVGTGSLLTVWSASAGSPFADGSTYAVSVNGAVVVLAADHSELRVDGAQPPAAFPGTSAHADRLLAEACRVSADGC